LIPAATVVVGAVTGGRRVVVDAIVVTGGRVVVVDAIVVTGG
jgi:hypothetical protein